MRQSGLPQKVLDELRTRGTIYTEATGKLFYEVHVLGASDIDMLRRHGYSLSHVDIGNGLHGVCAVFDARRSARMMELAAGVLRSVHSALGKPKSAHELRSAVRRE